MLWEKEIRKPDAEKFSGELTEKPGPAILINPALPPHPRQHQKKEPPRSNFFKKTEVAAGPKNLLLFFLPRIFWN